MKKSAWEIVCEAAAAFFARRKSGTVIPERPAPELDANDRTFAALTDEDRVFRALMDYAMFEIQASLEVVLDTNQPPAKRVGYADKAAGVMDWIDSVEGARRRVREAARQRAENEEAEKREETRRKEHRARFEKRMAEINSKPAEGEGQ